MSMRLLSLILILTGFLLLAIVAVTASVTINKRPKILKLCLMFACIAFIAGAWSYIEYNMALARGMKDKNTSARSVIASNMYTPFEDKLPNDLTGSVIIYYKYGCPDCEAVYPALSKRLSDTNNVYWISTEGDQGKLLLQLYPVDEVPSGIYIRNKDYNQSITYTSKQLYTTDETGNVVLDEDALDRLLYLQSEGR